MPKETMEPRIKPLEQPKGLFNAIMYRQLKRTFGKVILPAKVIYARYPKIGLLVSKIHSIQKSFKLISKEEQLLIQSLVAIINGCQFCIDMSRRKAMDQQMGMQRFVNLLEFHQSGMYTLRERAILLFVEEMTREIVVSDETYDALKKYCTDDEVIEITFTAASENFLNRMLKPLHIGSDELCSLS